MLRSICAGAVACALLPFVPAEAQRFSTNVTTNVRNGEPVTSCEQVEVRFDRERASVLEERRTIPRSSIRRLSIDAPRNGGIWVHGTSGDEYGVTLCKAFAAAAGVQSGDVVLTVNDGRVGVSGPSRDGWIAYLIVAAPREAAIDVSTSNGPLSLHDVSGSVKADTTDGPISLRNCSGSFDVEATNGPISLAGGSGSMRIRTENGPVSVKLTGTSWSGEGLEARAQNGPLNLEVPAGYQSGVQLDLSAHSPFSCRGSVCGQSRRDWDDRSRTMHFGGSETRVRLSTVNGPVNVDSR